MSLAKDSHKCTDVTLHNKRFNRQFLFVETGPGQSGLEVMIYDADDSHLQPLLVLNTIELPAPPSVEFCEHLRTHGFQVIFVRRPGFGASTPLPDVTAQALSIVSLIRHLKLQRIVLLGISSGNPVAYRLQKMCPDIILSIFANPVFNQSILREFQPQWFREMLRQAITSKTGARITFSGLRYALKREAIAVYLACCKKSWGDLEYVLKNFEDVIASSYLIKDMGFDTFLNELNMSLLPDAEITDGYFKHQNVVALSGHETTPTWQEALEAETNRLNVPCIYEPSGDVFVGLNNPSFLVDVIKNYTTINS